MSSTKGKSEVDDTPRGWSTRFALGVLIGIAVGCVAAYAAFWAIHVRPWGAVAGGPVPYAEAAAFGDAFGPVAGLLSTLALAAAVVSVFMQRSELELQRKELIETREELKRQGAAQEATAAAQHEAAQAMRELAAATRDTLAWSERAECDRQRRETALAVATIGLGRATTAAAQIELLNTRNSPMEVLGLYKPMVDSLNQLQEGFQKALQVLGEQESTGGKRD